MSMDIPEVPQPTEILLNDPSNPINDYISPEIQDLLKNTWKIPNKIYNNGKVIGPKNISRYKVMKILRDKIPGISGREGKIQSFGNVRIFDTKEFEITYAKVSTLEDILNVINLHFFEEKPVVRDGKPDFGNFYENNQLVSLVIMLYKAINDFYEKITNGEEYTVPYTLEMISGALREIKELLNIKSDTL